MQLSEIQIQNSGTQRITDSPVWGLKLLFPGHSVVVSLLCGGLCVFSVFLWVETPPVLVSVKVFSPFDLQYDLFCDWSLCSQCWHMSQLCSCVCEPWTSHCVSNEQTASCLTCWQFIVRGWSMWKHKAFCFVASKTWTLWGKISVFLCHWEQTCWHGCHAGFDNETLHLQNTFY